MCILYVMEGLILDRLRESHDWYRQAASGWRPRSLQIGSARVARRSWIIT